MRRLSLWLKQVFRGRARHARQDNLPFTAKEFGRLILSGKSEDMKILARGFSRATLSRNAKERAPL